MDRPEAERRQDEEQVTTFLTAAESGTLIDLFSGCGGGALGFSKAGLRAVAAVELDGDAADAYEANVGVRPLVMDIRRVTGEDLLRASGLNAGECTLLSGCPPCQSFTDLRRGSRSTHRDRLRNSFYLDYLRLAGDVRPRHIAFENVPGMLSPRWRPRLDALLEGLAELGYEHVWDVLDAADFGVPQRRRRLLVVASRVSKPVLPAATHADPALSGRRAWLTVREAVGSLAPLASGEVDASDTYHRARRHSPLALRRLRAIPPGGARSDLPRGFAVGVPQEPLGSLRHLRPHVVGPTCADADLRLHQRHPRPVRPSGSGSGDHPSRGDASADISSRRGASRFVGRDGAPGRKRNPVAFRRADRSGDLCDGGVGDECASAASG